MVAAVEVYENRVFVRVGVGAADADEASPFESSKYAAGPRCSKSPV
jgi:hypothetical protein